MKFVNTFSVIMRILMMLLIVFSLATVALVIVGYFVSDLSPISFAYLFLGDVLMPIEYLINNSLGKFLSSTFNIIAICTGAVLFILSIIYIRLCSKAKKNRQGVKKGVLVTSLIISFLFIALYTFSFIIILLNYEKFNLFLNARISGTVKTIVSYMGKDFIILKSLVFPGLIVLFSIMVIISFVLGREKGKKKEKIVYNLNFYSDEYINRTEKHDNIKEDNQEEVKEEKPRVKKQSQDLINKIIQLNQLKDSGQITEVQYTRQRQKLIRRYKG